MRFPPGTLIRVETGTPPVVEEITELEAIRRQKEAMHTSRSFYTSDDDALSHFLLVHWATIKYPEAAK